MGDYSKKCFFWGGVALVSAMIVWVTLSRQARQLRFDAIANEISSVGEFRKAPVVNHSTSMLWYARNEERGLGIHQVDLKTLSRLQLNWIGSVDTGVEYFKLFGWSPDDRYSLLYRNPESPFNPTNMIFVFEGAGKSVRDLLEIDWLPENAIWERRNSVLLVTTAGGLFRYAVNTGNSNTPASNKIKWAGRVGTNQMVEVLGFMSPGTLAYIPKNQTNENFWSYDLGTKKMTKLSHFTNVVFQWPHYNRENGQFLFCWTEPGADRRHLFRFDPAKPGKKQSPEQLTFREEHTFNGQWIQKGEGYAYVGNPGNTSYLAIRPKDPLEKTNLFEKGYIRSYTISAEGDKIYALASAGNEPQGIWEYDIGQKALRCIVPATNAAFAASEIIAPVTGFATAKNGSKIPYYMLPPRNFKIGKKYPVVIDGPSESRWRSHSQLLANLGTYYVAVNRRGLASSDDLSGAAEDVLQVHQDLVANPSVDSKKMFIIGFSIATGVVRQLVEQRPELWRGAVFLSPIELPVLAADKKYPRIAISIGQEDPLVAVVRNYEWSNRAHSIETVYYPNAGHMFRNIEHTRDRERRLAEFILRN